MLVLVTGRMPVRIMAAQFIDTICYKKELIEKDSNQYDLIKQFNPYSDSFCAFVFMF